MVTEFCIMHVQAQEISEDYNYNQVSQSVLKCPLNISVTK